MHNQCISRGTLSLAMHCTIRFWRVCITSTILRVKYMSNCDLVGPRHTERETWSRRQQWRTDLPDGSVAASQSGPDNHGGKSRCDLEILKAHTESLIVVPSFYPHLLTLASQHLQTRGLRVDIPLVFSEFQHFDSHLPCGLRAAVGIRSQGKKPLNTSYMYSRSRSDLQLPL